jgi:hypothetical protein
MVSVMRQTETWLPVPEPGFEELYEVSSLGQVRSLPRQTARGILGGRVLKQSPDSSGHLAVSLSRDGKCIKRCVHKLVAMAFLGLCPPGLEVCHGSLGQKCNWASNLRYDTHEANMQDRRRDGNYANAEKEVCPHCDQPYRIRPSGIGRYCVQRETENRRKSRARARERLGATED